MCALVTVYREYRPAKRYNMPMGLLDKLGSAAGNAGATLINQLDQRLPKRVMAGFKANITDRFGEVERLRPDEETVTMQGRVPNPLGTGELLNVSIAITTVEDAGGERTKIRARVQAPVLQRLAPSHAPRLSYEQPKGGLPAIINQLPGGKRVVRGYGVMKSEIGSRLPVIEPTGDEVTTVFDIAMNRRKSVIADGESRGLVARAKERFALMAGPENWIVDQQEMVTDDGFRGLMTIRSGDDSPVDVIAKVGVELKQKPKP